MVNITDDKLSIIIEHPCPLELVKDMRIALISVIQNQELTEHTDLIAYQETTLILLEFLKQLELD